MKIIRNVIGIVLIAIIFYYVICKGINFEAMVAIGIASIIIGLANIEERIK